jgi:hypothetical protein
MIIELALNAANFPAGGGGVKNAPQKKLSKIECSRVIASGQRSSLLSFCYLNYYYFLLPNYIWRLIV